jgi:hypothetical protein
MSPRPYFNPYEDAFLALSEQDSGLRLALRKSLIWAYSWAVPSRAALEEMVRHSPLIELGAGTGYWAWLLEQLGGDVVALDQEPGQPPHWHSIRAGGPADISAYPGHALFLCWPPNGSPMATQALANYRGQTVIYVGEWGGRTADETFHRELNAVWILAREIPIPCWPGVLDRLYVFKRI